MIRPPLYTSSPCQSAPISPAPSTQHPALNTQHSTLGPQHSALNTQPSAPSTQQQTPPPQTPKNIPIFRTFPSTISIHRLRFWYQHLPSLPSSRHFTAHHGTLPHQHQAPETEKKTFLHRQQSIAASHVQTSISKPCPSVHLVHRDIVSRRM